jgi:hypothetical protein
MRTVEKRLAALEEKAKPRTISTLVDLIIHVAENPEADVELSPALQELVEKWPRRS